MPQRSVFQKIVLCGALLGCLTLISQGQEASRSRTVTTPSNQSTSSQTPNSSAKQPQKDDGEQGTFVFTVYNVTLPVTVTNEDGNFVSGLKREDFQVLENQRKQPIVSFQKQDGLPLNLVLGLDLSTSVRNRLNFEKEAVREFLEHLLDNKRDRAALTTFNDKVELRHAFTSDFRRINQTVQDIKIADGQTALYDAVYRICTEQMKDANTKRRAILLVTDGADTGSRHTLDQAVAMAQKTEVVVYAISTKGGSVYRVEGNPYFNIDDKDLKRLCRETGGDVFFPSNTSQLKRAFELAEQTLRNQYYLVYEPTENSRDGFRKIEVRIVGKKGLKALTRAGYFATPQE